MEIKDLFFISLKYQQNRQKVGTSLENKVLLRLKLLKMSLSCLFSLIYSIVKDSIADGKFKESPK